MLDGELKKKFDEFDHDSRTARDLTRSTLKTLITLSAGIVGFSVSLFSAPAFQAQLDIHFLKFSWYCFLTSIVLGVVILLFEGRNKLGKTWKSFQLSQWPSKYSDYSGREKFHAALVTFFTVLDPYNLLMNEISNSAEIQEYQKRINGLVVHRLARLERALFVLENFMLITFVAGLILLVKSFKEN